MEEDNKKAHNKRHAGRKAEKKNEKNKHVQELTDRQKNPKAFSYKSIVKAQKQFNRTQNLQHRKHHIPVVDRTPIEPPPILIAVVGGPLSGKSTLIRSLIKMYTKQRITSIAGPVTVVTGKSRRVTFIEVNNDINSMIDAAKVADMVLMLIDITFGLEMEVFEFLEICRAHGMPRVMGILNHMDMMKDNKSLKKRKKAIKDRFADELYPGAKLFYLTGMIREEYMYREVKNLSRFIAVSKFRPLTFRSSHPYVCVDRWEDLTSAELIRQNANTDRDVVMYGYVRGTSLQTGQSVHVAGCGDYVLEDVQFLKDPCPLPDHNKKRSLNTEEKLIYAPFSGVSGVIYDKDAVYVDLAGSQHGQYIMKRQKEQQELLQKETNKRVDLEGETEDDNPSDDDDNKVLDPEGAVSLMAELQKLGTSKTEKKEHSIKVFSDGEYIKAAPVKQIHQPHYNNPGLPGFESVIVDTKSGRAKRRALIPENKEYSNDSKDDSANAESDDEESSEDEEENESGSDSEVEDENDVTMSEDVKNDFNSDESDVDDILTSLKNKSSISNNSSDGREPALKKKKLATGKSQNNDAFTKIQNVLESLNEGEQSDEEQDADEDVGYDSCGSDNDKVDIEEDADSQFQRAMFEEAKNAYYKNQSDVKFLVDFIYGNGDTFSNQQVTVKRDSEELEDDFLKPHEVKVTVNDEVDSSFLYNSSNSDLSIWYTDEMKKSIKDCFTTGTWKSSEDAETLLKLDDMDENLYGDFEDLTTGEKFTGKEGEEDEEEEEEEEEEDNPNSSTKIPTGGRKGAKLAKMEKIREKKRKMKEMLENEFGENDADYFSSWKSDLNEQAQLNLKAFEDLSDDVRVLYEGFRPGMYVRMRFSKLPCEFVQYFDPTYPVVVGGLLESEVKNVYNKVRMKVHRWYPKILKNRDPLIISIGWRRIQTMMHYGKREDDLKLRSLKYARKYLHVEGLFWGPYAPLGTGFVALQTVGDRMANFRIAANGVMLEGDKTTTLVKKLKLMGNPSKCQQKTAFITDMFHSEIEVSNFIGAKLMTQSGIRGLIKTSIGLKGDFRAQFEDKICMSDVIILKTWADVEVSKYFSVVRSLLLSPSEKAHWQGMKTVAQIKQERGIKNKPNPDSLYTEITKRRTYVPKPLKIPTSLQRKLPYKYKPKHEVDVPEAERVVIVRDPEEEKMDHFMQRVRLLMDHKLKKDKEGAVIKKQKYRKKKAEEEFYRNNRMRREKAAACKKLKMSKKL